MNYFKRICKFRLSLLVVVLLNSLAAVHAIAVSDTDLIIFTTTIMYIVLGTIAVYIVHNISNTCPFIRGLREARQLEFNAREQDLQ